MIGFTFQKGDIIKIPFHFIRTVSDLVIKPPFTGAALIGCSIDWPNTLHLQYDILDTDNLLYASLLALIINESPHMSPIM